MPGPGYYLFGEEERKEVLEVLDSRQLSRYRFDQTEQDSPSKVYLFERTMEAFLDVRHGLAMNSCTCALLAGLSALGIGPGDEVIVPGYTFIASIAAIAYARAVPVLAEIDESLTLCPEDVRRRITPATKAIMAVHMLGAPCDMDALRSIAKEHRLWLIEDAAQACGGSYRGKRLGSIGDVGAFSLNVFKTISAGDGGLLVTNDSSVYERAFAFHDHGFKPFRLAVADADSLLGLNLRMHELTGALALAQSRKLPAILDTLRRKKALFAEALGDVPRCSRRRLNDPEGDCATLMVLIFDDAATSRRVSERLGTRTLLDSGRHYYGAMAPLLNKRMPKAEGCPFECTRYPTAQRYEPHMLTRTDDLLARSMALSIGVVDSYLGSACGIDILTEDDEIPDVAAAIRERILEVS